MRARVSLSIGATTTGSSMASRQTSASLFMLRRCVAAEIFSLAYTSSGIFLGVKVVGISISNRTETVMVPNCKGVQCMRFLRAA